MNSKTLLTIGGFVRLRTIFDSPSPNDPPTVLLRFQVTKYMNGVSQYDPMHERKIDASTSKYNMTNSHSTLEHLLIAPPQTHLVIDLDLA
jgi:hypothetical protein